MSGSLQSHFSHTQDFNLLLSTICFRLGDRAFIYSLWGLIATVATFGLAFATLKLDQNAGWKSRAWSELIVACIALPISIYYLAKDYNLQLRFSGSALHEMLKFSLPLLLSSMISYAMLVLDRIVISAVAGEVELGLYSVAIQLSIVVGIVLSATIPVLGILDLQKA